MQEYFRDARADVLRFSDATKLSTLDNAMQGLLSLANGQNAKKSYLAVLRTIDATGAATSFDIATNRSNAQAARAREMTEVEDRIHRTLAGLVPSAADSYRQAIHDLASQRLSYRGPATDLREALREVLDHMAPDKSVMEAPGFKFEPNLRGPTMAQKMRFIMKQRAKTDALARPASEATELVDSATSKIIRSTYVSGSVNVHVSTSKAEVSQLKLHVDSALAQLLEIFC